MVWLRHGVALGLIVAFAGTAGATSTGWSDNFDGGAPEQTWITVGSGFSTYMNDRLYMQAEAGDVPFQARYVIGSYSDVLMRANVQMYAGYPYLAYLLVRGDALTMSGYVLGVSSPGAGGVPHLWIGMLTGGVYSDLASLGTQPDFDWKDCQVEFDVTGSTLSGKVWSTGSSEPASWQIQATDSSYADGVGGLMVAAYPALGWNNVWAAFDDVNLVGVAVPEPVTMAGLMMGIGGLVTYVRRRQRAWRNLSAAVGPAAVAGRDHAGSGTRNAPFSRTGRG
jgi:hypothetical protein